MRFLSAAIIFFSIFSWATYFIVKVSQREESLQEPQRNLTVAITEKPSVNLTDEELLLLLTEDITAEPSNDSETIVDLKTELPTTTEETTTLPTTTKTTTTLATTTKKVRILPGGYRFDEAKALCGNSFVKVYYDICGVPPPPPMPMLYQRDCCRYRK